jgi:hypothetical protein
MRAVNSPATEARGIRLRGERGISRQTIAQGRPDAPADTCMLVCVFSALIAHETAGASQHPAFPAPSYFRGLRIQAQLGRNAPRDREIMSIHVIASEAKQSILPLCCKMDCFASLAMTGCQLSPSSLRTQGPITTGSSILRAGRSIVFQQQRPRSMGPCFRRDDVVRERRPHNSRAFENANELTRRVFSSRINVRVIGGSARWLQFSRSQSRQLTPIGVPSAFSRSIPAA